MPEITLNPVHNGAVLSGRTRELDALSSAFAHSQPVLVTGEAGVGKTALLRTAAERVGCPVFEGGALATLSWMDYLPFTRALGRDPTGSDPEAVALDVQRAVGSDGLLILDDLQWASPQTVAVTTMLAGRVGVAVGVRTGTRAEEEVASALEAAHFVRVSLDPLDADDAANLAGRMRPGLSSSELAAVVRRAGGNPLLLRELSAAGEESQSLRRMVAARLRRLHQAEREAFAMLALVGRPLPRRLFAPQVLAGLDTARLVDRAGPASDQIDVRHALFGEAAIAELDQAQTRELHLRLANMLTNPGEAARHYDLAGEVEASRDAALRAADQATLPGERASHLRVAAMNSTGADADELRLAAAETLAAAHEWDGVLAVLDQVVGTDPTTTAHASLQRARAAWSAGHTDQLQPAVEAGLAAAAEAGPDSPVETLLRIEACRIPIFVDGDFEAGVTQARGAYTLAQRSGVGQARAQYFLGTALACLDRDEGPQLLELAIAGARADGDVSTELTAANNLVAYQESSGSPGLGADLARAMAARARELGLGAWESSFAQQALQLDFHAGRFDGLVEAIEGLAARPLDRRTRDQLVEVQCMALTDTGRADESIRLAEEVLKVATPDAYGRTHFWWTLAEAALWSGDPNRSLRYADRFLDELPEWNPNCGFGEVTRAWARFEVGEDPGTPAEHRDRPMLFALPHETAALGRAYAEAWDEATELFLNAAPLWAPYHVRGELRCEWAAGEMLRRGGQVDEAVRTLTMVEKRCVDVGLVPVLNRTRRSLRMAGERRTVPRTTAVAGLTGRELEVLGLVGRGLTNEQIAARLGITRRTVVAQIASASAKLGAANRLQAAAYVADLDRDPG